MSKKAFDQKLEALAALRAAPATPETITHLRKALKDRSGYLVSKAAALVVEFGATLLVSDLITAFDRFLIDGDKTDPKCWAKNALAQALQALGQRDPGVFLRGLSHHQPEPVWGGSEDSAVALRSICAMALVQCDIEDMELLERLLDLMADPAKGARVNAVRAIAQVARPEAALLLRLKAIDGDRESEVVGECLAALLDVAPHNSLEFVARFMKHESGELRLEAAAAMGQCREARATEMLIGTWQNSFDTDLKEAILYALGASIHDAAMAFLLVTVERGETHEAAASIRAIANGRLRERSRDKLAQVIEKRKNKELARIFAEAFEAST
jgi:HEAT repeat protein